MAPTFKHSVRAVVFDCIDNCGEQFTIPVELVSSEPATRGTITFTVRVNNVPETNDYVDHCMTHLISIDEDGSFL